MAQGVTCSDVIHLIVYELFEGLPKRYVDPRPISCPEKGIGRTPEKYQKQCPPPPPLANAHMAVNVGEGARAVSVQLRVFFTLANFGAFWAIIRQGSAMEGATELGWVVGALGT